MFQFIKKNFALIFIITFVIIFSIFNKDAFIKNYENKKIILEKKQNLKKELQNFSLKKIWEINNLNLYYTPYKNLLNKIVEKINKAQKKVYIEVYMFTEKRLQKALVNAKKRGVDVKVLLEKNPYKSPNINNKTFNFLKQNNIDISWSDSDNYSLNHSKFIIIDDEVIVSTWNLTYSTFAFNRDFFLFTKDKKILEKFENLFLIDFSKQKDFVYLDNIVLSPNYSRFKFKKMFEESSQSLDLYFQYLEDEKLEKILLEKAREWVKIRIIVSNNFFEENKKKIKFFKKNNIIIKPLKNIKMHSKAILVDNKYLFIWSENFSSFSLDKNREVWLIFTNKTEINKFKKIFEKDFAK